MQDLSQDVTKTITKTYKENNKALENLQDKDLKNLNDRGKITSFILSILSKITNPEHTSQIKLIKDPSSNRINDLLMNKTIPVILCNNLLSFRDTDILFELQKDRLKMITDKNYNVHLAKKLDKKYCSNLQQKFILISKL